MRQPFDEHAGRSYDRILFALPELLEAARYGEGLLGVTGVEELHRQRLETVAVEPVAGAEALLGEVRMCAPSHRRPMKRVERGDLGLEVDQLGHVRVRLCLRERQRFSCA